MYKKNFLILRFDDLGLGSSLTDWSEWINFIRAKKVKPIVCVVPNNNDKSFGNSGVNDFKIILEEVRKLDSVFLAHGFSHVLSIKGKPFMPFYKSGELLNLSKKNYERFAVTLRDFEVAYKIKFSGYAPPAHLFDHSFITFVDFNRERIAPVINDLYGKNPYQFSRVNFLPLLDDFFWLKKKIKIISVHPQTDRANGKIWRKLQYGFRFIEPQSILNSLSSLPDGEIRSWNIKFIFFKIKLRILTIVKKIYG
jgi:Uncharacterized protein conserved in bacteria (DUF2334)